MRPSLSIREKDRDLLKTILKFADKRRARLYIVGGYLRDIFLNRERGNPDIDFSLRRGAIGFGRKLAAEIKSGFVVLDKERGACRLVKRMAQAVYTFDFTDFRGKDLDEDLRYRDFSVNAMCVELAEVFKERDLEPLLIDPYGGKRDLKAKLIRMVDPRAFDDDPLRILRAFSFSCLLGFKIDALTLKSIKSKKDKLSEVSFERIRDELFKILDSPAAFNYLREMDRLRILKIIFPEFEVMRNVRQGPYHHLDVWQHTLETVRQLEKVITELKRDRHIQGYLAEVISGDRRRRSLIKLGALLHDIGKPRAKRREEGKTKFHGHERIGLEFVEIIAKRLKLSNDELDALNKMVLWHLRPGYLADNRQITSRAQFRYFRDTASEALSVLLLSMADQRATKGRLTSRASRLRHEKVAVNLIKEYFKKLKEKKLPRLINGNDLINKFKLQPSPLIGKILSEVEELQAIGRIKTKAQALGISRKILSRKKP